MVDQYATDTDFADIFTRIQDGEIVAGYSLWEGYLMRKTMLCVTQPLREKVMTECHCPPFTGHPGIATTMKGGERYFYWPRLKKDVEEFVHSCLVCQKVKFDRHKAQGLLQPLSIPTRPWESIAMDFIFDLPRTQSGHNDLSFNKIEKIEGLESLKSLDDLSLYCNQIKHLEGLDALQKLTSLSLGKNLIQSLDEVLYLRRLKNLQLLTLDGNPLCKLLAAREQYQDEMLEVKQKETDEELVVKAAQAKASQQELFKEANLILVDALFDSMLSEDPEYLKMKEVPGLLEALDEYRQKNESNNEEVIGLILEQHGKKKEEITAWKLAIKMLLDEQDKATLAVLDSFNKSKKKVFREIQNDPSIGEERLRQLLEANEKLKDKLLELEMLSVGQIQDLWSKFDDNYAVLVENCRQHFQNQYPPNMFAQGCFLS
ncbi:hypothetical protein L7F22_026837 [Adiantum nelumboides]|nr:hypothetical protein [Adiantum nelumboides]